MVQESWSEGRPRVAASLHAIKKCSLGFNTQVFWEYFHKEEEIRTKDSKSKKKSRDLGLCFSRGAFKEIAKGVCKNALIGGDLLIFEVLGAVGPFW